MPNVNRPLLPIICIALPFGLYGWAICLSMLFGYDGTIAQRFDGIGTDWMIFYSAARAWFENHLALVYDQNWIKTTVNTTYVTYLATPLDFPAFHYPPITLLFLIPFGYLSFYVALAAFEIVGAGLCIVSLRRMFSERSFFLFMALALFLSPAATYNLHQGQNGFFVLALTVFGFALLKRSPVAAGIALGLLCFKPQCALIVPFALLGGRHWRVLGTAIGTVVILAAISMAVFGWDFWQGWFDLYLHPRHDVEMTGIDWGRTWDTSIFTCVRYFGISKSLANVCQVAGIVAIAAFIYRTFKVAGNDWQKFAILLAATVIASPHPSPYDMMPFALAAALYLWSATADDHYRPLYMLLPLSLWLAPIYNPPIINPAGLATIPIALLFAIQIVVQTPALRAAFLPISHRKPAD